MGSKSRKSSSRISEQSEYESQCFCLCGLQSPTRVSWTRENPRRRFHGCVKYREGFNCGNFKWVDANFSHQAMEVILELLQGWHGSLPIMENELDDADSMQMEIKGLESLVNHLKNEVSRMKIQRDIYLMLFVLMLSSLVWFVVICNFNNEKKLLSLP
ncbi:hypothetical protein BT93_L4595 [Corymbia citriodora subsp. variegata]|uniref:GRF-type domain-containing protein n=1 Tax=Corymbia citriodora subsp. variegata TaxID=360336 RepID=A0A8T0CXH4_CORYI|nr:hypothetical protein BT93_L4595 [Corymbia citriodora subsp. variegata]